VHLQFLGYPILNDIVYGGRFVGNNIIKLMKENKINKNIKNNKNKYINNQVNNIKS
jgi:23S rRNA-/tRNA-specific pseudouridylate synthase